MFVRYEPCHLLEKDAHSVFTLRRKGLSELYSSDSVKTSIS